MRIICKCCGRIKSSPVKPEHMVCKCKEKLIWFGDQDNCEILETGKRYPKNLIKNIRAGNIYKMSTPEKTTYFEEKYPKKQ